MRKKAIAFIGLMFFIGLLLTGAQCEKFIDKYSNDFIQKNSSQQPSANALKERSQQRMSQIINDEQQKANQLKITVRGLIDQKRLAEAKLLYQNYFDEIGQVIKDVRGDEILDEEDKAIVETTFID